jgi:hypothetical protein
VRELRPHLALSNADHAGHASFDLDDERGVVANPLRGDRELVLPLAKPRFRVAP